MSRGRLLILVSSLAAASAAVAGPPGRGPAPPPPMREPHAAVPHESRPEQRSLADAVRRVERATGGQILSAERVPFEGHDMNRIKVLDATGRVRVITDDPQGPPPRRSND